MLWYTYIIIQSKFSITELICLTMLDLSLSLSQPPLCVCLSLCLYNIYVCDLDCMYKAEQVSVIEVWPVLQKPTDLFMWILSMVSARQDIFYGWSYSVVHCLYMMLRFVFIYVHMFGHYLNLLIFWCTRWTEN